MTSTNQKFMPAARLILTGLCAVALLSSGCGGDDRLAVVPARGTLVQEKKDGTFVPIPKARIVFHPVNNADGFPAFPAATTDEDGSFALGTYSESDGAPEGEYVVTIDARKREAPKKDILGRGERPVGADPFRGKYSDRATSPLRATVAAGQELRIVVPAP